MVRIKRSTRSISSQRVTQDNDPSICLTAVKSGVEQHGIENSHASSICFAAVKNEVEQHGIASAVASSRGINGDLEERNSKHCLTTSAGYPVVESDNNKNIATDQLSKPCDMDTKIVTSDPDSITFDNVSTDVKLESYETSECSRKGSLFAVAPLNTYYRKKGFLRPVKSFKTYRRRRKGYVSLGMTSLPVQNSMENKVDISEEISAANTTPEQSMQLDTSEMSDIIVDERSDMLSEGNNHNDASCGITSYTELVETMEQQVKSQPGRADEKLLPEEVPNGSIKRKLLVLDINGLLADIVPVNVSHEPDPDKIVAGKEVFKRPFCDEFLEFCFQRFNVGIWSSRTKRNVESVLNFLMGEKRQNFLFRWDQSHCLDTLRKTRENDKKPLLLKNLNKLWDNYGDYDSSNTLLLDDSPYKALLNPPNTAIFPRTYQYSNEKDNSLGPNGDLRIYLEGLSMAPNVQNYVKQNPYGQDPITEKHASWSFYLEVIESSEKLLKEFSEVNKMDVVAETSKEFPGSNGTFQQRGKSISTASPCSRGFKRGRSLSPRHDIGRSQSHSLSPKKYRRSKSPAPSDGAEFGSDKATNNQTVRQECRNFSQGRCLRGTTCRFEHHQSCHQSYADRGFHQKEGQIFKPQYGPRECRDFVQGKCSWGESCRFLHSVPEKTDVVMEGNVMHGKQCDNIRMDKAGPRECRDFVQGKCSWGASCRFLHSVPEKTDVCMEGNETHSKQCEDIRMDKSGSRECRDFVQGKCSWGASCRFLHHVPEKTDVGMEGTETHDKHCDDIRRGRAIPRGCYDFIQGKCNRGESCRFQHSLPEKTDLGIEEKETHDKTSDNIRSYKAVPGECRDFLHGKCSWGASCRYLHSVPEKTNSSFHNRFYQDVTSSSKISDDCGKDQSLLSNGHGNGKEVPEVYKNNIQGRHLDQEFGLTAGLRSTTSQPGDTSRFKTVREVCKRYTWGRCFNGVNCRYLHQENQTVREVCRNYTWGRCHNGSTCRYLHQESNLTGSESTSQVLDMSSRYRAMPEMCRNNSQGRCYKGSSCQFLHSEPLMIVGFCSTSQLGKTSRCNPVSKICRNYTQGKCHKGSHCTYLHQELGQTFGLGSTAQFGGAGRYVAPVEACKNYIQGRCHKGSDCRYQHRESGLTLGSGQFGQASRFIPRPGVCINYTLGRCHKGSYCQYRHQEPAASSSRFFRSHQKDGDVPLKSRNFGSFGDTGSIRHETSAHEHTESRTEDLIPEEGGTVEALPNQHIDSEIFEEAYVVPDAAAKDIKHLESDVRVSIDNLENPDRMVLDADNRCHETSVHEDTEPQTKEMIPNFPVIEEKRGSFRRASAVPDDDTRDEKVPEDVVCASSIDNLGDSDRIMQEAHNQPEQMSDL